MTTPNTPAVGEEVPADLISSGPVAPAAAAPATDTSHIQVGEEVPEHLIDTNAQVNEGYGSTPNSPALTGAALAAAPSIAKHTPYVKNFVPDVYGIMRDKLLPPTKVNQHGISLKGTPLDTTPYTTPHGAGVGAVTNAEHNIEQILKNKVAQEALKTPGFHSPGNSLLLQPTTLPKTTIEKEIPKLSTMEAALGKVKPVLSALGRNPVVRKLAPPLALFGAGYAGQELYNQAHDSKDGYATGGLVQGYADGNIVNSLKQIPKVLNVARKLITPTAQEVEAFVPKASQQVKLSDALQNQINKYLGLHQSDPMGTHGTRMGGTGFSEFQHTIPLHNANDVVWANASEEAANRLARQGQINGKDVIWTNYVGAPDQHRTNRTVTNNILDEFYKQQLTPDQYDAINNKIATAIDSKKRPYFPQTFDIRDKFATQELGADTFHKRGMLTDIVGRGEGVKRSGYSGLSNFDDILESHRDPRLIGAPTSAVGTRLQEIYPEATQYAPQFHPDYHYPVFGKDMGVSFDAVPQEIAIPDFVNAYRASNFSKSGKPLDPHGNAMFGYMKNPQLISEDYIKWLQSNGMADGGLVEEEE